MSTKRAESVFKITFMNQGEVYEIFARRVTQGALFGFIEIEELLFGERSSVVVDPSEERLKHEFAGVRRIHVPLHAVIRVDEMEKRGVARITPRGKDDDKVAPFPTPIYTPTDKSRKN